MASMWRKLVNSCDNKLFILHLQKATLRSHSAMRIRKNVSELVKRG